MVFVWLQLYRAFLHFSPLCCNCAGLNVFVIAFSPLHCNCAGLKVQKAQEFILYQEMAVMLMMNEYNHNKSADDDEYDDNGDHWAWTDTEGSPWIKKQTLSALRKSMETMTNSPYNFDILPTIWDISTLKKSFYVNLMLPKCLWNHTKFAPKFLNMEITPPLLNDVQKNCGFGNVGHP